MVTDITRAESYYKRGLYYFGQAKWDEAANNLRDALDLYPEHHLARLSLGASLGYQNLFLDAIQILEEGRQKPSVDNLLRFRYGRLLGSICLRRADYPAAVYYLKIAYDLSPDDVELMQLYAGACCKAGQFQEGFDLYLKAKASIDASMTS